MSYNPKCTRCGLTYDDHYKVAASRRKDYEDVLEHILVCPNSIYEAVDLHFEVDIAGKSKFEYGVHFVYTLSPTAEAIIKSLKKAGFNEMETFNPPFKKADVKDRWFYKDGTAVFGMWTEKERKQNLALLKEVFKEHGIQMPKPRILTFAELI